MAEVELTTRHDLRATAAVTPVEIPEMDDTIRQRAMCVLRAILVIQPMALALHAHSTTARPTIASPRVRSITQTARFHQAVDARLWAHNRHAEVPLVAVIAAVAEASVAVAVVEAEDKQILAA